MKGSSQIMSIQQNKLPRNASLHAGQHVDSEQVCPLENLILHWKKLMLTKQPLITTKQYHNVRGTKTKIRVKFCGSTEQGKISSALGEMEDHTWEFWGRVGEGGGGHFCSRSKRMSRNYSLPMGLGYRHIPGTENSICKGFNMKVHGSISEH